MSKIYSKKFDPVAIILVIRMLSKPEQVGVLVADVIRVMAVDGHKPVTVRYWLKSYAGQGWKVSGRRVALLTSVSSLVPDGPQGTCVENRNSL